MASIRLNITVLWLLAIVCCVYNESSSLTTPVLVQRDGFPIEAHTVQTFDGYILTMHRIPYSPKLNSSAAQRPVAFLFHGAPLVSSCFVLNGPERSLAYILSNAGYDVWMGNARGTEYSKDHVTLSTSTSKFWDFSWHEIGIYDTRATIDYALNVIGESQVRYFGHSQGTTTFLVVATMIPSFKSRIRSAHLLAPVAFMDHSQSTILKTGASLLGQPSDLIEWFGHTEISPSSRAIEEFGAEACKDGAITQDACADLI